MGILFFFALKNRAVVKGRLFPLCHCRDKVSGVPSSLLRSYAAARSVQVSAPPFTHGAAIQMGEKLVEDNIRARWRTRNRFQSIAKTSRCSGILYPTAEEGDEQPVFGGISIRLKHGVQAAALQHNDYDYDNDNEHRFFERERFLMQYSPTENPEAPFTMGESVNMTSE